MLTIAILAKDKATTLPFYLHCIHAQSFPKDKTNLYIRTNDNTDNTVEILEKFIKEHGKEYHEIYYDDSSIDEALKSYSNHEWNCHRFNILADIRQKSVDYAATRKSWYFVCDCDNFIGPETISTLMMYNLEVVAPLLYSNSYYSNYHSDICENGYLKSNDIYYKIYDRQVIGVIQQPVIHCTYLIRPDVLPSVKYNDGSGRYEYVIFSDILRKRSIPQYLSNIDQYFGYIVFWQNDEEKANGMTPRLQNFLDKHYKNFPF